MRSPQISAGIIPYFIKDDDYYFLCVKHQRGHRGFPKGGIGNGESEKETAMREFQEETGIQNIEIIESSKIIETFFIEQQNIQKTVTFFLGKLGTNCEAEIDLQTREMADYYIGRFDEVYEKLTFKEAKKTFAEIYKKLTVMSA